jgi:poly-gamma-glutamate synthesis protein (capsule biosynthesis protein)
MCCNCKFTKAAPSPRGAPAAGVRNVHGKLDRAGRSAFNAGYRTTMCLQTISRAIRKLLRSRLLIAVEVLLVASTVQAQQRPSIRSLYSNGEPFLAAIEAERLQQKPDIEVTGIAVPHHLLSADLIARGFWAASANSYDRIILVSPDHFNRSRRPLATTRQDLETPFGTIRNDTEATGALLSSSALFDDSDLFQQEHGVAALLPFAKHFFPHARVVPVAVSYGSTRAEWDAAVAMLEKLVEPGTLIVQSTDYSHYLTQQIAIRRDQETLNAIASNDIDLVARLLQPDHMDSKGSQYIQMRLQSGVMKARGIVIANRNSVEYSAVGTRTTSYIVTVYLSDAESGSKLRYDDQDIVYFGGDVFIGRWLTQPLADPEVASHVVARIRSVTAGAPLILNLEGVLLHDPPQGISPDLHMMHASLAVPILKALNVRAAGLANNHSYDLGRNGLRETVAILKRAGIKPLRHMQTLDMARFGLIAVNFIGVRDYKGYPVVKNSAELQILCRMKARSPLIALVHWGEEYTRVPQPANHAAAHALHVCGVNAVIGAHSHQASLDIEAMQGGEFQMVFSLGNLLFDQRGDRASSALLELRLFKQGTFATRLVPLPNLFEIAAAAHSRKTNASHPLRSGE